MEGERADLRGTGVLEEGAWWFFRLSRTELALDLHPRGKQIPKLSPPDRTILPLKSPERCYLSTPALKKHLFALH